MRDKRTSVYEILTERDFNRVAAKLLANSELEEYRFVFSTKGSKGTSIDVLIGDPFSRSEVKFYLHNLLSRDHFNFIRRKFASELLSNRRVNYRIDRCILIDNQGISYLRKLFDGSTSSFSNAEAMIKYLLDNKISYDATPYLVENAMTLKKENYEVIWENLISFIKFKNLDEKKFIEEGIVKSLLDDNEAVIEADGLISHMRSIQNNMDNEYIHKYMISKAVLTKAALLKLTSKNINLNCEKMIEFCHSDLSLMPLSELRLALSYLGNDVEVEGFFSKIQLKGKNTIKAINSMSWDLAHLRSAELAMKKSPRHEVDLTICSFLTFDKDLAIVSKFYKYDSFAYSDNDFIPYVKNDFADFTKNIARYFDLEMREVRKTERKSVEQIRDLVLKVEDELKSLIE